MATNTVGIDKEVEVNRKENLRDHRLYSFYILALIGDLGVLI